MWDTDKAERDQQQHLSHDMPCLECGHAPHRYLPCDDHTCTCSVGAENRILLSA